MTDNRISQDFFRWIKNGNSGCIFARMFALQKDEPWESVVIYGDSFDESIDGTLSEHLIRAITQGAEAIQILFPQIKTAEQIASLIAVLCKSPNWYCSEIKPKEGEITASVLLGLRWVLPDQKRVNWVLGFANIESMPPTRRAPCTALILRLGDPGVAPSIAKSNPKEIETRKSELGRIPVHLADMPVPLKPEGIVKTWKKTEEEVRALLGADVEIKAAAHAKVTFSLPAHLKPLFKDCFANTTANFLESK